MLKLILLSIFPFTSFTAFILLAFLYLGSEQKDPKYLVFTFVALGSTAMSAVKILDYRKSRKETEASESADRKKKMRGIRDDFKVNFSHKLIDIGIIRSELDLTDERIYELSQDEAMISILRSHKLVGILNGLEDFAELYTPDG